MICDLCHQDGKTVKPHDRNQYHLSCLAIVLRCRHLNTSEQCIAGDPDNKVQMCIDCKKIL